MVKPDLDDPKINRAYAELARHYGVLIDPPALSPQGQAQHRGASALHPLQLLRRAGLAVAGGDGHRRAAVVRAGRRAQDPAGTGGAHPGGGVRRRGGRGVTAAAAGSVRAGQLEPATSRRSVISRDRTLDDEIIM